MSDFIDLTSYSLAALMGCVLLNDAANDQLDAADRAGLVLWREGPSACSWWSVMTPAGDHVLAALRKVTENLRVEEGNDPVLRNMYEHPDTNDVLRAALVLYEREMSRGK